MKPEKIPSDEKDSVRLIRIIIIKTVLTAMAVIGIFGFTSQSQPADKKDLPIAVASSFAAKYANAPIKKWKKTGDEYLISFRNRRQKCVAFYASDGSWRKTEIRVPWTKDLPVPVRDSMKKNGYATYRVDGIKEVVSNGNSLYVLHVDNSPSLDSDHYEAFKRDYVLSYSEKGVLINKYKLQN